MPCYAPLQGYRSREVGKSGKRKIVFKHDDGLPMSEIDIPCGQCVGCRLERSRQWALRCVHEASLHEDNCFITLTYNEENLPYDSGLHKQDMQKFFKRLRKKYAGKKIRYFSCGEYGEQNNRPHYHACLFGFDFPDREIFKTTNDCTLYTSNILADLWPFGFSTIGNVTFESAAYVARYIMKKVNGEKKEWHYTRVDPDTGEVHQVQEEYTTMSRRPGIGKDWYDQFKEDCYPSDTVIMRGKKMQPPKYYDSKYEHIDEIKLQRKLRGKKHQANNTPERLRVREQCKQKQISSLTRPLDGD